jgi:hypothetical protein
MYVSDNGKWYSSSILTDCKATRTDEQDSDVPARPVLLDDAEHVKLL